MWNGKATIILLTVLLVRKILLYQVSYFPEIYTHSKNKIKVELDLTNHATKSDFKKTAVIDISEFAKT